MDLRFSLQDTFYGRPLSKGTTKIYRNYNKCLLVKIPVQKLAQTLDLNLPYIVVYTGRDYNQRVQYKPYLLLK